MTPEHAAYQHGLATGREISYRRGDLFQEDFSHPVNPYVRDETLCAQFSRGLERGLGEDFLVDLDLWLSIEIRFSTFRETWGTDEIRREGRACLKSQAA